MRPLGHRRQVLLFLVAILVPSLVLVGLSLRMISQERELTEKRRADERRRLVNQLSQDLLSRLELIKWEVVSALARHNDLASPAVYANSAVALVASIDDQKLLLPWERDTRAEQTRKLLSHPDIEPIIRQGEQQEFAAGQLEKAVRSYQAAMQAARHPIQVANARLLHALALGKLGRRQEALAQFRILLQTPGEVVDEDGVPLKLFAAERLLAFGVAHRAVLDVAAWAAQSRAWLPPTAYYLASGLADRLMQSAPDPKDRAAAQQLHLRVQAQLRQIAQAQALQADFPRLNELHSVRRRTEAVWIPYGEETWLLSTGSPQGWPAVLVALGAQEIYTMLGRQMALESLRFLTPREPGGDPLGDNFPGLKVSLDIPGDYGLLWRGYQQRRFYYFALLLVLGMTMFGAYLLWRDLRRDVRLAEVRSQFVSSVSHELKTPLTAIRMFAETLQMGRSQDARTQSEYLDTIVGESERLSRLVDDVLLFSKIEQGKKAYHFRPLSLSEVVRSATRALQYPLSQQGFELRVQVEDDLPRFRADHDALEQAILNLLSNAMKYSGDARTIELELYRNNREAVIRVTDHGLGIASEEQGRIFEKYYRAPTRENQLIPGTGLGLTLVAHIVKAHGGRVELNSAPGEGSAFSICLPMEGRT